MTHSRVAPDLPTEAARLLRTVDVGEVLGASRQLHVLAECLMALARAHSSNPARLHHDVSALEEHVRVTRGASSQMMTNGLGLMTAALLAGDADIRDTAISEQLVASVAAFRNQLSEWQAAAREHATTLLAGHRTVMAYDYSSSVSQAVVGLTEAGQNLRVVVPEARSLDGGRKYLADWAELGIVVEMVPDCAIGWGLSTCDAALAGAETLSREGGCYNTIGTSMVANEAARRGVPFYVLSVLLKTDFGTLGAERPSPTLDFLALDGRSSRLQPSLITLDGSFPDLDYTEPAGIAGIVTERGTLAPADLGDAARSVLGPETRQ